MTLGASNKKHPWVEKQKNPVRNFKLRSMILIVRPSPVGRKPMKYHCGKRECHRILPNDKSTPHEQTWKFVDEKLLSKKLTILLVQSDRRETECI